MVFSKSGELYATPAAQLTRVEEVDRSQAQRLHMRSGLTQESIEVDQLLPQRIMNVFEIPASHQPSEPWLRGVALDGAGVVHHYVEVI